MADIERLPCGVEHELRADAAIIRSWIDVANGPINREALADRLDRYANAAAELNAEIEALRAERDALAKDAAKYRWGINNARWVRGEQEAYVAIPVAPDADLSCVAMRDAAIGAAMQRTTGLEGNDG